MNPNNYINVTLNYMQLKPPYLNQHKLYDRIRELFFINLDFKWSERLRKERVIIPRLLGATNESLVWR